MKTLSTMALVTLLSIANTSSCITMYERIRQLPKAELHLHLGGSYPLEYLRTIATPEQYDALKAGINQLAQGIEYQKAFAIFGLVSILINNEQKVEDGTFALCKALQDDNVTYVEIRTGLKNLGAGNEEYLNAVLRGIQRASSDTFKARVVLSLQRNSSSACAQATVDLALKYRDQGVIGIDISGDSTIGNGSEILSILLNAKKQGLAILLHIGESALETDQLVLLQLLQPDRVGHAVHLTPEAHAWIMEHKIPIEVCLTSSVLAKMLDHHTAHPGIQYYKQNHPVVICTDDPLLFRTSLTQELLLLLEAGIVDYDGIEKIAQNSFRCALVK